MDTRVEIRTAGRIDAYHLFVAGADGWQAYPSELHCGAALLTDDAPVVTHLVGAGWTSAASGDGYVLLTVPR